MSTRPTGAEPLEPDRFDEEFAEGSHEGSATGPEGGVAGIAEPGKTIEGEPKDGDAEAPTRQARAPWHFKVLLVGSIGYLGWRAYQGVSWLAHHIH